MLYLHKLYMIWLVEVLVKSYTCRTNLENVFRAHPIICYQLSLHPLSNILVGAYVTQGGARGDEPAAQLTSNVTHMLLRIFMA